MKFVVDTNIAFSAVLNTESKIGDLIMNSHGIFEFHACDTLRSELKKHRPKLLELSKSSEEQLDQSEYQITNCLEFTNEALICPKTIATRSKGINKKSDEFCANNDAS